MALRVCKWNYDGIGQGKLAVLDTQLEEMQGGTPHSVVLLETGGLVP